ncbi:hypothetical protein NEUTE1DRAFT_102845 [Neurospora tetrasperma FGSC 2508]|uniref:Uncharacterized protein n=1 Tax=Neurospora tetrasperma (strain FGSC 2508 / ATCC MYA-4615 / P0657) TaxID=510951 RepID=F8MTT0_NEUT8|nr:uncharacterized protein NEUTE1DRAFT_102845 [Neurospora tetrasperma FGSC 2508]EGO55412.1 hypothetical protein NEUTE1DRAFT_102845 [Neurospora tetrasperma FGSC 2508]EGZ69361.1 hypothetical protein NEUTE2DRAFT_71910 [Neurospora tetrasperma FGSC 2509]
MPRIDTTHDMANASDTHPNNLIYMKRPSYLPKSALIFPILLNLLSRSCCCPCCCCSDTGNAAGPGTYSLPCPCNIINVVVVVCPDTEIRLCCCPLS